MCQTIELSKHYKCQEELDLLMANITEDAKELGSYVLYFCWKLNQNKKEMM